MGKKKDKAAKSKKKSESAPAVEAGVEVESEAESIQYAEQVTAADVMELINTLSQDINRLDESNQLLQQQVAQSRKAPQPQNTILKIITIILAIGIVTVGYSSVKINSRTNENTGTGIDSAGMDKMASRITTMDTSMQSMTSDIDRINTSLDKLTADVTTLNQNVNKVASDLSKINTSTSSQPQHNQYMARPMEPWPRW
jgi:archaellum component FlaC